MSLEADIAALTAVVGELSGQIRALQRDLDARLPAAAPQPLPTRKGAAELLQVTPSTIDRMARDGRLQTIKIGRSVRIDPRSIAALMPATEAEITTLAHEARS